MKPVRAALRHGVDLGPLIQGGQEFAPVGGDRPFAGDRGDDGVRGGYLVMVGG